MELEFPSSVEGAFHVPDRHGWRKVEDELPEIGRDVLVYNNNIMYGVWFADGCRCAAGTGPIYNVTHWMPLPNPPEN